MRCMPLSVAVLSFTLVNASSSHGLTLQWSGGGRDLQATEARSCTLFVRAAPGEALPLSWHLSWVARSEAGTPITFAVGGATDPADVCDLRLAASSASVAARADTALHCPRS